MGDGPERFELLREVFAAAAALPAVERPAYLASACGGDASLLQEAQSLLDRASAPGATALDGPAAARGAGAEGAEADATRDSIGNAPARARGVDAAGYRVLRELSRGGQGVVYLAVQASTGRKVALKLMREGPLADEGQRRRFDREAHLLAALDHPNIVAILDRGRTAAGLDFIAMDYVHGLPLDQYIARHCRPADAGDADSPAASTRGAGTADALRLFAKVCDAVHAAHVRGIVHRDLKPGNVLVDERGEPRVLDFGLARPGFDSDRADGGEGPLTVTGQFMGSLPWASPEQAEGAGERVDVRSDVYSLGVILYQSLTGGRFPYEVAGPMRRVLDNIANAQPTPPSRAVAPDAAKSVGVRGRLRRPRPAVAPALESVVLKALSKRREDRYQTAGELGRDVLRYLEGKPTAATAPASYAKARRRLTLGLGMAAALVLAAAAWRLALSGRHGPKAWGPARPLAAGSAAAAAAVVGPPPKPVVRRDGAEGSRDLYAASGPVLSIVPTADPGVYLVGGGGRVRAWDVAAAEERAVPGNQAWPGSMVAASASGKLLAQAEEVRGPLGTGGGREGRLVRVYDAKDGHLVRGVSAPDAPVTALAMPDDRTVLYAADGRAFSADLTGGEPTFLSDGARVAAFSSDGRRALFADGNEVLVMDLAARREVGRLRGHTDRVSALAFSRDGRTAVSGGGTARQAPGAPDADYTVRLWDPEGKAPPRVLGGPTDVVNAVAVSTDGAWVAAGCRDGDVWLWDARAVTPAASARRFRPAQGEATALCFSPDGKSLISGHGQGFVRVWPLDAPAGQTVAATGPTPGGTAAGEVGPSLIWGPGRSLGVAALVSAPARLPGVDSWTIETRGSREWVPALAAAPDGSFVAVASGDGAVRLLRPTTGELLAALTGHTGSHLGVEVSSDSRRLAVSSQDLSVTIWDVAQRRCVNRFYRFNAGRFTLSKDGSQIVQPSVGSIAVCDTTTGRLTKSIPLAEPDSTRDSGATKQRVAGVVVLPDGNTALASLEPRGGTAVVDLNSGAVRRWLPPEGRGRNFAWPSSDGALACLARDDVVAVYEVGTGRLVSRLKGLDAQHRLAQWDPIVFTKDNRHVIGSVGGLVQWDVATGEPLLRDLPKPRNAYPAVAPAGATVYAGSDSGWAAALDPRDWSQKFFVPSAMNPVTCVAYGGGCVAWGADENNFLTWSPANGARPHRWDLPHPVTASAVSGGPRPVAAALTADGMVNTIDIGGERLLWSRTFQVWQSAAVFSGDGSRLVIVGGPGAGSVSVIDAATGTLLHSRDAGDSRMLTAATDASGRALAAGSDSGVWYWDDVDAHWTPRRFGGHAKPVRAVSLRGDGRRLAAVDESGDLLVWELPSGKLLDRHLHDSPDRDPWHHERTNVTLAWQPDGMLLANRGRTAVLWDTDAGVARRVAAGPVLTVGSRTGSAVGADGLVVSAAANMIRGWDPSTGLAKFTISYPAEGRWLAVSPDGHYAGPPGVEEDIVYVVQSGGAQQTLTPAEFSGRFGWKNDPGRAAARR